MLVSRSVLQREPLHLRHVDEHVLLAHLVRDDLVEPTGEVDLHPVRQVPAVGEVEAEDRVAGLDERVHRRGVGLRAGVRLDVGVRGVEQGLQPVDREVLRDVDELAAAVVALAGIALGVLVGEDRAHRFEHRFADKVL